MTGRSFVGDIGLVVFLDCGQDVSAATGLLMKVKKPDETTTDWSASLSGTNYIKYTIQAGDLNQSGDFRIQAQFTLGSWVGRGRTAVLTVYPTFAMFEDEV